VAALSNPSRLHFSPIWRETKFLATQTACLPGQVPNASAPDYSAPAEKVRLQPSGTAVGALSTRF
jgi:hypothetical protein